MIKQKIVEDLKKAVEEYGVKEVDIVCDISKNPAFGDYSSNIALQLSKQKLDIGKQNPIEIANKILEKLQDKDYLEKIEVAGGGFLNFFVKSKVFKENLEEINLGFGKSNFGSGKKVVLEHTSVNPNKTMHIGHLRNAVIGDVLVRILRKNGYQVEVQNYIDDTGVQVADTYVGLKHLQELNFRTRDNFEPMDEYCWDLYTAVNQRYEQDPNFLKYREDILRQIEQPDSQTAREVKELAEEITHAFEDLLASFDIFHDLLVWESDILKQKFWQRAFEVLKKTPGFEQVESGVNKGTWVVRFGQATDEGHTLDKIFVRSDGTTTYIAKDFAYNLWKFGLLGEDFLYKAWGQKPDGLIYSTNPNGEKKEEFGQGDKVFTVIDERQSYLYQVLVEVFKRLGYQSQSENLKHIAYGVVTLSVNTAKAIGVMLTGSKKSYAMAGRKGIGVKVKDLHTLLVDKLHKEKPEKVGKNRTAKQLRAESIAISAIKYYMIRYNSATEIVFDFEQALSLFGATGPYLQYTHARVMGILEKVVELKADSDYCPNKDEVDLIKLMLDWPFLIEKAAQSLEPSILGTYAFDLAQHFNTFYERNRVIDAAASEKGFRQELIRKFQIVYKDVLDTLGIKAPERM